jgi:hypothetical protein
MGSNALFFGWNRPIPGREQISAQHFQEFVQYLGGLQKAGTIQSFDVVFLTAHGGDMNGFFLIRGDTARLNELTASTAWVTHITRAGLHLQGAGVVNAYTGDAAMELMKLWTSLLPA